MNNKLFPSFQLMSPDGLMNSSSKETKNTGDLVNGFEKSFIASSCKVAI